MIGNEKSVIDGAMNANGKVFITNPNGTIIGKNAQINVGGLVATTANISNDDFMNGRYQFHGGSQGAIENLGQITVPEGGVVALIAPIVKNGGTITAPKANVLLASAERFSITLPDNQNFAYTLDQGTLQGLVDNGGAILADGGHVVLTAKGIDTVKKSLIKHSGVIEANTVQNKNGVIELLGDLDNTRLEVSGTLKAEAKAQGDGGFIETSASQLDISEQANISTHAENGKTGTWLIDPKDFTVAPSGGDTTGAVVSKGLEQNNVTLKSRDGAKEGKGDVVINDEISWNKNTLTLNAEHDIHINKNLTGAGTAKLALEYGQGTTDGGESDYHLKNGAKVNLPVGKNFSTKKGSQDTTNEFTVIHSFPNVAQNYTFNTTRIALGKDIDLSYAKTLKDFGGWSTLPVFDTYVHGLGHYVDKLSLNSSKDNTGLFREIYGGSIRDLGLKNLNIKSSANYTGGLVGRAHNDMTIRNVTALGNVQGIDYTGSMIGQGSSTNLKNVKFIGNIIGDNYVGGLAGESYNLNNVAVIGNVRATGDNVGGLSGVTRGDISDSLAGTIVKDVNKDANIINVTGVNNVGGLVGLTYDGSIHRSFAVGNINGDNRVAGLMGMDADDGIRSTISESYFVGNVTATGQSVGGLGGYDVDHIHDSYVSGNITGVDNVGGLVGDGLGYMNVYNTYYNGVVSGTGRNVSNLFGVEDYDYTYDNNYFNIDKTRPLGKYGYGKSLSDMMKKSTYEGWDFDKVWRIDEGNDYPRLRALTEGTIIVTPNKTDVGVQAHDLKKVYDGKEVSTEEHLRTIATANGYSDIVSVSGLKDGDTLSSLGGLTYGGTWQGAKNAGKYSIVPSGLNGGQKYEIKYGEGSLTIDKRPITIIANKVYDGTNVARVYDDNEQVIEEQIVSLANTVSGDDVRVKKGTEGVLKGSDALSGYQSLAELGTLKLEGNSAENYELVTYGSRWLMSKKPVRLSGNVMYSGMDWVFGADLNIDKSDIMGNDQIFLNVYTGDVQLDGKDVSQEGRKIIGVSKEFAFAGEGGENYIVDKNRSLVYIFPKTLSVSTSKYFDGNNVFDKNFELGGIVHGDTVNVSGTASVSSHMEGVYREFKDNKLSIDNKNYQIGNIRAEIMYLPFDPLNSEIYKEVSAYEKLIYGQNRFKYDPYTNIRIYSDYELARLPTEHLKKIVDTMRSQGVLTQLPKEHRQFYTDIQGIINEAEHFDMQLANLKGTIESWVSPEGISVWTKTIVNIADVTTTIITNGESIESIKLPPEMEKFVDKYIPEVITNNPGDATNLLDKSKLYNYLNILGNSDAVKRILDTGTSVLDGSTKDVLRNLIYGGLDSYLIFTKGNDHVKQLKEVTEALAKLVIALTEENVDATGAFLAIVGISAEITSSLSSGKTQVFSKMVSVWIDSWNNGKALANKASELSQIFSQAVEQYWDGISEYHYREFLIETIRYNQDLNKQKRQMK